MKRLIYFLGCGLLIFFPITIYSQSNLIIDLSQNDSPILLKGVVNVTHGPDDIKKDSVYVKYFHYILIDNLNDTIKYKEIFEPENRDSLMVDQYEFILKEDTMIFNSLREFYNFGGFGKTIFLRRPKSDSLNHIHITPKKFVDSLGVKIDTNYYYFSNFNLSEIIHEHKNIDIENTGNEQKININFLEKQIVDVGYLYARQKVYYDCKSFSCIVDDSKFFKEIIFINIQRFDDRNLRYTKSVGIYKRQTYIPEKLKIFIK